MYPRSLPTWQDSVISHDREGSELAQFGFILPLPLLIGVARLVKLLGQVSEDLMHFRVVDDLGGRQVVSRGWVPGHQAPTALVYISFYVGPRAGRERPTGMRWGHVRNQGPISNSQTTEGCLDPGPEQAQGQRTGHFCLSLHLMNK